MIRTGLAAALVISGVSAGCSGEATPAEVCNDRVVALCSLLFRCETLSDLARLYGYDTQSECVADRKALGRCDSLTEESACQGQQPAVPATKYHHDRAETCNSEINAATCEQYRGGVEKYSPACLLVCQVP